MEPWQLGVTDAVALIAAKELSPVELTESLLARIDKVDGDLAAWVMVDTDGAADAARTLEAALARGAPTGPLAGALIGIKDVIDVAGLPTTASSRVLVGAVAADDAACVTGLRTAGAAILGKLHTAEFANADPPPTRNPWNPAHTPGGSSTGSAVSVASGMAPAALGTQTAGSILRPALYNGVVGVKASFGLVSKRGVIPVGWTLDHVGVIARSVPDAAAVLAGIAGYDPLDPSSAPEAAAFTATRPGPDRPPVVGLLRTFFLERCEPELLAETMAVAAALEGAGADIRELDLDVPFDRIAATHATIMRSEMYAYHREQFARSRDLYGPRNTAMLDEGRRVPAHEYVVAQRTRRALVAGLEAALAGVDVALTPGTPAAAPRNTTNTGDASFQTPWSYAGLPTVGLPTSVNRWGLPIGVQLVGHRWADADLLGYARWCEEVIGFAGHPPCWDGSVS